MRKTTVLAGALLLAAAILGHAPPAGAGGWAVSALDATPVPVSGQELQVGFTVRQHGVSPVNPEGEVGIEVRSGSGAVTGFAARPEGATGHYVADVTFPEAGRFTWQILQGWFAPTDLGAIDVTPAGSVTDGAPRTAVTTVVTERAPWWARTLVPLVGVAGLALMLADRRPRRTSAAVVGR
jgi:hypothetical protein